MRNIACTSYSIQPYVY